MLLSARRAVVITSVTISSCVWLITFWKTSHALLVPSCDLPKPFSPSSPPRPTFQGLDPYWTSEKPEQHFAYVQYATDLDYLCNAMINFARLQSFAVEYDMLLIYPTDWDQDALSQEAQWIENIRSMYPHVKLRSFPLLTTDSGDWTWRKSLTKFHAFALSDYSRVLAFDSDSSVLKNMDHYFLAPQAPVAVPRAYWLNGDGASIKDQILGSHVMLIEPNEGNYRRILDEALSSGDFDMEVLNHLFNDSAMILPHRRLALLSGEFRATDHRKYLSEDKDAVWDAHAELSRSHLVHFSDWPLPKPWKWRSKEMWQSMLPPCLEDDVEDNNEDNAEDDAEDDVEDDAEDDSIDYAEDYAEDDVMYDTKAATKGAIRAAKQAVNAAKKAATKAANKAANKSRCADRLLWSRLYETYDHDKTNVCEALRLGPLKEGSPDGPLKATAI